MKAQPFCHNKSYTGPLQAAVFDLSGTALDPGCFGNVAAFKRSLEAFGLKPTIEEIRQPMGLAKRDHVGELLKIPRLANQWQEIHGRLPDKSDADAVFAKLLEIMPATLADYADPAPGLKEVLAALRQKGIKIGACTAYSRPMMQRLLPLAKLNGFDPDCLVASDEVAAGRPWPWMCWRNCEILGVYPPESVIKIGDTVADIEEGINAGFWSIGVTRTSSAMGLSAQDASTLAPEELARREAPIAAALKQAGANFVLHSIEELPALCEHINSLLAAGATPLQETYHE